MTETIECAVVGAGVVGLAITRALAEKGHEVVVLESAETIGSGISSRNSEVIHAGIYYPKDSLKARFCVRGRKLIYDYLASHGIEHRRCGKLIVAADDRQVASLEDLKRRGEANGVDDLTLLDPAAVAELEPALRITGALLSPSTGILDSHSYMLSLRGDAEARGAAVALLSPVLGGHIEDTGIVLHVGGTEPMDLACSRVVNAAGLGAQKVGASLDGLPPETIPRQYISKGNYFHLTGRPPFQRLVYPVPDSASLGVHYTLDLGGQGKFGPDVQWIDEINYDVDPGRADAFYAAIRHYWPGLPDGTLQPGYAGIRPKLVGPGEPPADFVIQGPDVHGVTGLINLYGIESPGLTSSLAIGEAVAGMLQ